jgi:hypothetical protein
MRSRILGVSAVFAVVLVAAGFGYWRFGSTTNAVSYLNGEYILADRTVAQLGSVDPGKVFDVTFNLTNVSSKSIRLVGANCACSCLVPRSVPLDLPGGETTPVVFNFNSPKTAMEFEQVIQLYFDDSLAPLKLSITGATK